MKLLITQKAARELQNCIVAGNHFLIQQSIIILGCKRVCLLSKSRWLNFTIVIYIEIILIISELTMVYNI